MRRQRRIAQFNASYSDPATLDAYSLRVDHKLRENLTLFGRYNYSPSLTASRGGTDGFKALNTIFTNSIHTQTATLGTTWLVSSATANDFRFNYSRTDSSGGYSQDNFGGAVPLQSFLIPSPFTVKDSAFYFQILDLQGRQLYVGHLDRNLLRQINVVDSLSVQRGSHSLKFGGDFRRLTPLAAPFSYLLGVYFSGLSDAQAGQLGGGSVYSTRRTEFLFRNLGLYAQDTWRVNPRLTLTYGVRWDVDVAPQSLTGPNFPAVTGLNLSDLSNLALAPAETAPYKTTYDNFSPRIGAAYQLRQSQDWQTVLRGGYGIFYDLASSEAGNTFNNFGYPFGGASFNLGTTFPPVPALLAPPAITSVPPLNGLYAFDPNLKLPYTLQWNIALEQAIGKQQTVSTTYIGAAGRRLLQTALIFTPAFSSAQLVTNAGTSDYDALQVQFQRRLSHGFQALASYSWSHSIDTASAGSGGVLGNLLIPSAASANRGPSDFDIRNKFSAGVTYEVPSPRLGNSFTAAIVRGWSLQNVIQAWSAVPVDPTDANFFEFVGGIFSNTRPDLVPGQPLYLYGPQFPGGKAFNPNAFTDPPAAPSSANCPFGGCPARQGTVPRNFLRGFGATQWDFAVHREFPVRESLKMQFRAEMFNVLNHPNFGQPSGQFGAGGFGVASQTLAGSLAGNGGTGSGSLSSLYAVGGPRSIQLALKLSF